MRMLVLFPLLAFSLTAADRYPVDWRSQEPEILNHFLALLRIDTSNPPGNETKAVEYLKPILDKAGIEYKVLTMQPGRANLVARIRGNGSKRPIILMGHTDVVGTQRDKWPLDPFAAVKKDGYIWARGASDDKPHVVAGLVTLLLLKRMSIPLDRDVIFIAESGEEGTSTVGIDFLVNRHWSDIEAEYALAEGGSTISRNGAVRFVSIATTEKAPRTTRLVARGSAGHGSVPRQDNPLLHLSAAVAKFQTWQPPMRLNDTTRTYFERLATISAPAEAYRYNHVTDPAKTSEIQQYFAANEPANFSLLRTSVVPTMINAGFRSNVIPSQAEATLDIRALPDEDMPRLYAELRRVINDPSVEVVPPPNDARPFGKPSPLDSELFKALEAAQRKLYPGAITIPGMLTGATDMAQLRQKGVKAYGFGPVTDESEYTLHGAHSDAERLLETSMYDMVRYLWEVVIQIAAKQ